MRRLTIDMNDLTTAFEERSGEAEWYLDLETGEVVLVTSDTRMVLDDFPLEDEETDQAQAERFAEWLKTCDWPDWQRDEARKAYEVDKHFETRFTPVPSDDSSEAYRDMEEFAETVQDERLGELLWVALDGKGAFRRFKDVLFRYPEERARWFAFQEERVNGRLLEWLESEEVEVEN